jgi:hypothetical protein
MPCVDRNVFREVPGFTKMHARTPVVGGRTSRSRIIGRVVRQMCAGGMPRR